MVRVKALYHRRVIMIRNLLHLLLVMIFLRLVTNSLLRLGFRPPMLLAHFLRAIPLPTTRDNMLRLDQRPIDLGNRTKEHRQRRQRRLHMSTSQSHSR